MSEGIPIKELATRTGIQAGTIRMWEQRYGFPQPGRTDSGYRVYSEEDVETLRRVAALRARGLSVPAALERAREWTGPTDRPSLFGAAVANVPGGARILRKRTMLAISRAIEDETLASGAGPIIMSAFQLETRYRAMERRYRRLARVADATIIFADFERPSVQPGRPAEIPIPDDATLGDEWSVVVDAPGYAACLVGFECLDNPPDLPDRERRFETVWTVDPEIVRKMSLLGAAIAAQADPAYGQQLEDLLSERPLAYERPAHGLTALTNRIVAYLEEAAG
jgi:DNA-binding transcriptional MerR regulator